MKEYKPIRFLTTIVVWAILLMMSNQAEAQEVFADLAGMNHVESTYVSGRFAHNNQFWRSNSGSHVMDLSRGFSSLYSYRCYSEEAVGKAMEILKKYLKSNSDIEVVMKTTQGLQEYVIYEKFLDDGNKISQMIIWNREAPNVCEIVVINWDKGVERGPDHYSNHNTPLPSRAVLQNLGLSGSSRLTGVEFRHDS